MQKKLLLIGFVTLLLIFVTWIAVIYPNKSATNDTESEKEENSVNVINSKPEGESSGDQSEREETDEIPEGKYQNPVFTPVFADPSILRGDDGYFYAYATEDDWGDGSGGKVAPVIRSTDLVNWEYLGSAFESKPSWKDGWVWAPDVSEYNGKYYMYYTKSIWGDQNPGIGVAIADQPDGPFEDHGKIIDSKEMGVYAIDPMLFVDEGTPYLFFGGITSGIFAIELAPDGLSAVGERKDVIGTGYEAPYIIKRDGYYYFFGSNGSCCNGAESSYNVGIGRSESLFGPYLNKNGDNLLYHRGDVLLFGNTPVEKGKGHIVGPGHNAIVTDDAGVDWLIYHGIPADDPVLSSGATRRPLFIDKIEWVDGWPKLENLNPSTTPKKKPVIKNN
ncbi:family 43 glycosylhydrolase [Gracilibacillus sp. D59]|uniref:family 43 glycosylhydrolase n=1 Tax=Gracilibacillus sp. D59 TaxID=3457434 RepID=UPI003FCE95FA